MTPIDSPDDSPDDSHTRPPGTSDETVAALGTLSEALEVVEHARGLLYGFHRLTGKGDLTLGKASDALREAGHNTLADELDRDVIGRNAIRGRWTFQIVEDFDDNYYQSVKSFEARAREQLVGGRRHLFEAEMKEDRRSHGLEHHEATP